MPSPPQVSASPSPPSSKRQVYRALHHAMYMATNQIQSQQLLPAIRARLPLLAKPSLALF